MIEDIVDQLCARVANRELVAHLIVRERSFVTPKSRDRGQAVVLVTNTVVLRGVTDHYPTATLRDGEIVLGHDRYAPALPISQAQRDAIVRAAEEADVLRTVRMRVQRDRAIDDGTLTLPVENLFDTEVLR